MITVSCTDHLSNKNAFNNTGKCAFHVPCDLLTLI